MKIVYTLAIALLLVLLRGVKDSTLMKVKFTNVACEEFDKPFATFKKCFLKAVARDKTSLYIHVALYQVPVNNVTLRVAFFQRGNGYRPYMYNNSMNFCQFLKNPKRQMFWKILFDIVKIKSNINHSCPFNNDIIVDGLILTSDMFKLIPFPSNDYMFELNVGAYNRLKATVRIKIQIQE